MIAPNLLVRDAALVAVFAPVAALAWGGSTALGVAVGAAAGWFNFALWAIAAQSVVAGSPLRAFIPLKLFAAIGLVAALDRFLPGLPALVGFALPMVAALGRPLFSHSTLSRVG